MSKSYKPAIAKYLFVFVSIIIFILSYVGIKLQIDFMRKEKIKLNEKLEIYSDENLNLKAKVQFLNSELRIKSIAINELGMTSEPNVVGKITINKELLETYREKINN